MPKYRIIFIDDFGLDPCNWQVQKRKYFFFWENVYGRFSSATTAGREVLVLMNSD